MRYALSTWLYADRPLDAALRDFKQAGFAEIEVWADKTHLDPRYLTDAAEALNLVRKSGLGVHSIHGPFHDMGIGSEDPAVIAQTEKTIVKTLEFSHELESGFVVLHPVTCDSSKISEAGENYTKELFQRLADRAQQLGVGILVENLPKASAPYNSMAGLNKLFPDPRIGLCLDVAHAFLNGFDILEEIAIAAPRLYSCHVSNNDGKKDSHSNMYDGLIAMDEVLDRLAALPQVTPVLEITGSPNPEATLEGTKQSVVIRRSRAQGGKHA